MSSDEFKECEDYAAFYEVAVKLSSKVLQLRLV